MTVLAASVEVGTHPVGHLGPIAFNLDTLWATAASVLIVVGLGLWMRSKWTSGVPSGIQLAWETAVSQVETQVEDSMGLRAAPFVVPLAIALFFFILISNWLELIPTGDHLPAPTADANTTYALGLIVIIWMHIASIRRNGVGTYVKHYFQPYAVIFPINVIEELVKPFTLALRLFGNIFAGGVMISIIGLFPYWLIWAPNAAWKIFDFGIGAIQAFIFALLTILYFSFQLPRTDSGTQTAH